MYIVCYKKSVKSLWLCSGSSQDRARFCSKQKEAWLEPRDCSMQFISVSGVGKEVSSEKKWLLPVKPVWWMEQWGNAGHKGSKQWLGTGPELTGAVGVVWLGLAELCSDHFCMWITLFCAFLLLTLLLLLFLFLISVLLPVNCSYSTCDLYLLSLQSSSLSWEMEWKDRRWKQACRTWFGPVFFIWEH